MKEITKKQERELFEELAAYCQKPGYINVIAFFALRDLIVKGTGDELVSDDFLSLHGKEKLIRSEIFTLIGLMRKSEIDTLFPDNNKLSTYIVETENLLENLHMNMMSEINLGDLSESKNPLNSGDMIREAIFYAGDSAYASQYRDLAPMKYSEDNKWLMSNKGFTIDNAISVAIAIEKLQTEKGSEVLSQIGAGIIGDQEILSVFNFTPDEISKICTLSVEEISNILESFCCSNQMASDNFRQIDDFNPANAFPIIKTADNSYYSFSSVTLFEAIYETPFYWMLEDKNYVPTAQKNRGYFTESLTSQCLKRVFEEHSVFENVFIKSKKNETLGEIDVLVIFSNKAIIVQAKSKRLTLGSRKGNIEVIKSDFKKAIQNAYDQAISCIDLLEKEQYQLFDAANNEIKLKNKIEEYYPFCTICDHYPSLSYQSFNSLNVITKDSVKNPFVMDVFLLDALTEYLDSPIFFFDFVKKRTTYHKKILTGHELIVLAYYLRQNLNIDEAYSLAHLDDSIIVDLDHSIMNRRDGSNPNHIPDGMLKVVKNTNFGKLLEKMSETEQPELVEIALKLLCLDQTAYENLNNAIESITKLSKNDRKHHDVTFCISEQNFGISIHSSYDELDVCARRLEGVCKSRKYAQQAEKWFGIVIHPDTLEPKIGLILNEPWQYSEEMNKLLPTLKKGQKIGKGEQVSFNSVKSSNIKAGRNDPCPCGSGKKYKKCHYLI